MTSQQRAMLLCSILNAIIFPTIVAGSEQEHFFETRVRPLLIERCHKCHSSEQVKGGLRLDSREAILHGGDSGPSIVIGNPDDSLLIQAVRQQNGLAMPPEGRLNEGLIADLAKWIKSGALWPGASQAVDSAIGATPVPVSVPPNHGDLSRSLQLWLRADSLLVEDGAPVPVWPDQSGNGRDVSATRGVRTNGVGLPGTYIARSHLQKRPAVRFDTKTGYAASPARPVEIQGDAAFTILVVMNLGPHDVAPPYHGVFGFGNPANPGGDPGRPLAALIQINQGENHALHFAGGWNHDASLGSGSFLRHYGKTIILSIVKRPGPMRTTTRLFINAEEAAGPSGNSLEGRDTVPDIQHRQDIGAYLGKAVNWAGSIQGDIGEVIVYNQALSDFARVSVEGHLAEKYGLALRAFNSFAPPARFTEQERSHWVYQAVGNPQPPSSAPGDWAESPIDQFMAARHQQLGVSPAPPCDKRTLLRRVTFDLTGLPPTPEEISEFLGDDSPCVLERVVDRLLNSPHYGERWGRHWLDVVRYAESTANDANAVMRYAWRYRNYVIDAFNRDLPYDQFLTEQLAGDLLPATEPAETIAQRIIATGFLMIGPKALAEADKEQSRLDIVDDQIDVVSRSMLGLTIGCARCHDHKFDAIRTTDYYALAGIFRSIEPFQNEDRNATMWWEFPVSPGSGKEPITVMAPKESTPRDLRVHLRGNRFTLGATVPRGTIQIIDAALTGRLPAASHNPPINSVPTPISDGSGRLELARWITDRRNPLTARVMVNRIWQHHFGRGLVATSDNFGMRGERPSHPELLDWLATRFMESGWSVKAIHRLIVLSSTYQQANHQDQTARTHDPDLRWLTAYPRRRLSAEEIRDAILAASGQLDRDPGTNESGEYLISKAENINSKIMPNRVGTDDPIYTSFLKRSIYLPVVRNMLPDAMTLFDAADPNGVTAVRNETTVSLQSLFLLNSRLVRQQSHQLARLLLAQAKSDADRIQEAHERILGQPASNGEVIEAGQFFQAYLAAENTLSRPESERQLQAWTSYCQALFCTNEFLYVE